MLNLIRTDYQLGNSKTIVGNINLDLVLETLGKVYIKSGKNLKLLLDVIGAVSTSKVSKSNIIFVNSTAELEALLTTLNYPGDGVFVFNLVTKVLSLTVNNTLIPLIDADINDPNKLIYVQKSGDTMTGLLEINVRNLPPLIVKSDLLVSNLNSNYLEGYSGNDVAVKKRNEYLSGEWTFGNKCQSLNKWIFKDTVTHHKDIITNASIGTPLFYPGFSGSGWRLDGTTNTLTIDNLVVRKLMQVYEMVINKIRATNGSLWVTDSDKCSKSEQLIFVDDVSTFDITNVPEGSYVVFPYLDSDNTPNITTVTVEGSSLGTNQSIGSDKNFIRFHRMFHIINPLSIRTFVSEHITLNNDTINQLVNDFITTYMYKDNIDGDVIQRIKDFYYPIDIPTEGDPSDILAADNTMQVVVDDVIYNMNIYYKYFGCLEGDNNYYIISTEEDYPVFRVGDVVRCQKMISTKEIKCYDLIIHYIISESKYLVLIATSVLDLLTSVEYDEEGNLVVSNSENLTPYTKGVLANDKVWNEETLEYDTVPRSKLGMIEQGDELVRVGSIQNKNRQGAVYITSSDDQAPYIDVLSDLNRPDYSVLYKQPVYITYKKWKYVGTIENRGTYLGKFHKDVNTNEIIKPYTPTGESDPDDVIDLYGYEFLNYNCLILHKKVLTGEEDGNPIYSYVPVYDYTKSVRARLGKLDGIYDYRLGNNQPHGYGLYSDNVFLTGEFYLNNGKSIASFADDIALLSGEILHIDIDQLKLEVTASVENIIESKFKSTTDDDEGNEIPAGFAGLFTFDYTDITGDGVLDGKKGLAVLGDSIVFYTSKDGKFDFNDPTALIQNKKINADLIDVKELEFDKLVGKRTVDTQCYIAKIHIEGEIHECQIIGIFGIPNPAAEGDVTISDTFRNEYVNGQLLLKDFIVLKESSMYRIHFISKADKTVALRMDKYDGIYVSIKDTIIYEGMCQDGEYVDKPINIYDYFEVSNQVKSNEVTSITINTNGQGETVLYHDDGSVLNAKIFTYAADKTVSGCVEYFFDRGVINLETLLLKGDEYVVENYINSLGKPVYGLLKRIQYIAPAAFVDVGFINGIVKPEVLNNYLYTELKELYTIGLYKDDWSSIPKENYNRYVRFVNSVLAYIDTNKTLTPVYTVYQAAGYIETANQLYDTTLYLYKEDPQELLESLIGEVIAELDLTKFMDKVYKDTYILSYSSFKKYDNGTYYGTFTIHYVNTNGIKLESLTFSSPSVPLQ